MGETKISFSGYRENNKKMVSHRDCITLGFITQVLTLSTLLRKQVDTSKGRRTLPAPTECAICLDPLYPGTLVQQIRGCRHIYHPFCLELWIEELTILECPLCRFRPDLFADPLTWDGRQLLDPPPLPTSAPYRNNNPYYALFSRLFFLVVVLLLEVWVLCFVCDVILSSWVQSQHHHHYTGHHVLCGSHIYLFLYQGQCALRNTTNDACFTRGY